MDWGKAEALARDHVRNALGVTAEIEGVRAFAELPFFFGLWWAGGSADVLVYGDAVHPEKGFAALVPFFASLDDRTIRALTHDALENLLIRWDAPYPGRRSCLPRCRRRLHLRRSLHRDTGWPWLWPWRRTRDRRQAPLRAVEASAATGSERARMAARGSDHTSGHDAVNGAHRAHDAGLMPDRALQ